MHAQDSPTRPGTGTVVRQYLVNDVAVVSLAGEINPSAVEDVAAEREKPSPMDLNQPIPEVLASFTPPGRLTKLLLYGSTTGWIPLLPNRNACRREYR